MNLLNKTQALWTKEYLPTKRSFCFCNASDELIARSYTNLLNGKEPNQPRLKLGLSILEGKLYRAEEYICSLIIEEDLEGMLRIGTGCDNLAFRGANPELFSFIEKYNSKQFTATEIAHHLTDPNELLRAIIQFYNIS